MTDQPFHELTSTLASAAVVTLWVPHTEVEDTPPADPVAFWLRVFPTADETAPD